MIDRKGIVNWLKSFAPGREVELARQYRVFVKSCPLVLEDLALRCHAYESVVGATEQETFCAAGRREVFLHIQQMAALPHEEMMNLIKETDHGQ